MVSSYNVFLRLARGSAVVATLDRLTKRLARLYLAGRVGCPVVLVSGEPCRQELHTLPERFPGLASALRSLELKPDGGGSLAQRLIKHLKSVLEKGIGTTRRDSRLSKGRRDYVTIASDCLQDVPLGKSSYSRDIIESCRFVRMLALRMDRSYCRDDGKAEEQFGPRRESRLG